MKDDKLPLKSKIGGQLQRPALRRLTNQASWSEKNYASLIAAKLLELRCRGFR